MLTTTALVDQPIPATHNEGEIPLFPMLMENRSAYSTPSDLPTAVDLLGTQVPPLTSLLIWTVLLREASQTSAIASPAKTPPSYGIGPHKTVLFA